MGGKGGIRGGKRDITISRRNVAAGGGTQERQYNTEKTSSDSTASYYADEQ